MFISVIDTETTGLDFFKHEIIQLGLIEIKIEDSGDLTVLQEHEYKIIPKNIDNASTEALLINGYTKESWTEAIDFSFVVPTLDRIWSTNQFLLGQNLIFDLRFITKEYKRLNLEIPNYPKYIDTKEMGSNLVKEGMIKSSSMDKMCAHFNVKFKGRAHTALTDCQRTVTLWQQLQKYTYPHYYTFKEPYDPHASKNATKSHH